MYQESLNKLPVTGVLDQLKQALKDRNEVVLQAPPGAGKTTLVPLALREQEWLQGKKILVLEPRRIAARAAAHRMAELLGESVGQTVGYRIRMDSCVGDSTRIEVITEGILTNQLQRDPGLENTGLVIFDEFHERNLDSDLCLALSLHGRESFREGSPLKLLVMSATLDGAAVSSLLGEAPVVTSEGRQFPVKTTFCGSHSLRDSIIQPTVDTVMQALRHQSGGVLVFLPGKREILATARVLAGKLGEWGDARVQVVPLYGGLSLERQRQAIAPAPPGQRKLVLATNIAETSLTIEGVNVVVDSGRVREPVFDPATGITRLTTRRISQASAEQRRGRAGRQSAGVCYRLWAEQQHARLAEQPTPEIRQSDLAPMALQLLSWGVEDVSELRWLDPPADVPYQQGIAVLERCGAAFCNDRGKYQLTPHGVRLAQIPLHPRLSHMLLVGCDIHAAETACLVAALMAERNPLSSRGVDIGEALRVLMGEVSCPQEFQGWFRRTWEQAKRYGAMATSVHKPRRFAIAVDEDDWIGVLLASAYPDRIARLEPDSDGLRYRLSNGRQAVLPEGDNLTGKEWLAVADLGGQAGDAIDRIYSASALEPANFQEILSPLVREEELVQWDKRRERFIAERRRLVGSLQLGSAPLEDIPEEARVEALLEVVRARGLDVLPWNPALRQWRSRIMLLHRAMYGEENNNWPDLSDEGLLESMESWLAPYLGSVSRIDDFQKLDLNSMLRALLPWPLPLELERMAPERWAVPSGSNIAIDYSADPPVLAVKLQEMFGCEETPTIADGRVPLVVHLLSPGQRPLQITQDLAGFWRNGYREVKKEMKGRYPKHPWPDNPLQAQATRLTKKAAGSS